MSDYEKKVKKEKKRNLNTIVHSLKKEERKKRTFLGKVDSA